MRTARDGADALREALRAEGGTVAGLLDQPPPSPEHLDRAGLAQLARTVTAVAALHDKSLDEQAAHVRDSWTALAGAIAARSIDGDASNARHAALARQILDRMAALAGTSGMAGTMFRFF